MAEKLYGNISGAVYDPVGQLWTVPCDAEVDMALQFGYVLFLILLVHIADINQRNCLSVTST